MNKSRHNCPNCSTDYDLRATICQACGRARDHRIVEHSVLDASYGDRPDVSLICSNNIGGVPEHLVSTHQSVHPSIRANQLSGGLEQTPIGVTYRPRSGNSANSSSITNMYVIGAIGAFIVLLLVIGTFSNVYEMTKPTKRPLPQTVERLEPSEQLESETEADLDHKRFTRAKSARDLKEAANYSKLLAEKAAEAQQLEDQRFQYEQSQRMIHEQWVQFQRSQQTYQVTGSGVVHVGPRGGRYTYTKNGNKRYLPSSKSSSGGSRRHKLRR